MYIHFKHTMMIMMIGVLILHCFSYRSSNYNYYLPALYISV